MSTSEELLPSTVLDKYHLLVQPAVGILKSKVWLYGMGCGRAKGPQCGGPTLAHFLGNQLLGPSYFATPGEAERRSYQGFLSCQKTGFGGVLYGFSKNYIARKTITTLHPSIFQCLFHLFPSFCWLFWEHIPFTGPKPFEEVEQEMLATSPRQQRPPTPMAAAALEAMQRPGRDP